MTWQKVQLLNEEDYPPYLQFVCWCLTSPYISQFLPLFYFQTRPTLFEKSFLTCIIHTCNRFENLPADVADKTSTDVQCQCVGRNPRWLTLGVLFSLQIFYSWMAQCTRFSCNPSSPNCCRVCWPQWFMHHWVSAHFHPPLCYMT